MHDHKPQLLKQLKLLYIPTVNYYGKHSRDIIILLDLAMWFIWMYISPACFLTIYYGPYFSWKFPCILVLVLLMLQLLLVEMSTSLVILSTDLHNNFSNKPMLRKMEYLVKLPWLFYTTTYSNRLWFLVYIEFHYFFTLAKLGCSFSLHNVTFQWSQTNRAVVNSAQSLLIHHEVTRSGMTTCIVSLSSIHSYPYSSASTLSNAEHGKWWYGMLTPQDCYGMKNTKMKES